PALHPATLPLHTFLTYPPSRHILSLSLRDPSDNQNMPANTNVWVQAKTVRGVRKVTVQDWITWSKALRPDILWAFVDVPKTLLNGGAKAAEETVVVKGEGRQTSQKRTTKSLERSTLWLQALMGELKEEEGRTENKQGAGEEATVKRPPIIVSLLGGCDPRARNEYSLALVEKLDRGDSSKAGGLRKLDDGIMGYAVDLVDLPTNCYSSPPAESAGPANPSEPEDEIDQNALTELLKTSLKPLTATKPRIAHSAPSPHAILRIILESGFDLFDVPWVAEAADLGIALDFDFPVSRAATVQDTKSQAIGLNLFEERFADDFTTLGTGLSSWVNEPTFDPNPVLHSTVDQTQWAGQADKTNEAPGFKKSYIHHLLHTHEMSAYALLHMHNLAV
ncbi:5395_t:CDS:1, partial [Acaulospora colombiana]